MTVIAQVSMKMSRMRPPGGERVLDGRGNGQELCARPENALPNVLISVSGVALDQKRDESADQANADGRQGESREMVTDPPLGVGGSPRYLPRLSSGRAQDTMGHRLTIFRTPDATREPSRRSSLCSVESRSDVRQRPLPTVRGFASRRLGRLSSVEIAG